MNEHSFTTNICLLVALVKRQIWERRSRSDAHRAILLFLYRYIELALFRRMPTVTLSVLLFQFLNNLVPQRSCYGFANAG